MAIPVLRDHPDDSTKAELHWNGATYVLPTHRCALWMNILVRPVINAACQRGGESCADEPRKWTPWGYMP